MKKITLAATILTLSLAVCFFAPVAVYADSTYEQNVCEGSGGTWSSGTCTTDDSMTVPEIIQTVANVFVFVIGAVSVIMIIVGGIRYAVSAGDQSAVTGAKNTIMYAIVGLAIAFASYAIVSFIIAQFS